MGVILSQAKGKQLITIWLCSLGSVVTDNKMTSSVRASQDLYAQYQQQKKRIEEELRLIEERDVKWQEIHSG